MDMMETWYGAAMAQPHPVTLSGGLVHFQTDMDGLMQITGTGNIIVTGKNMIDDSKRYSARVGYSIYIGSTGTGYDNYLKAGNYRFTVQFLNNAHYELYYRKSDKGAVMLWSASSTNTTVTFTLAQDGWYRFNMTGANPANVGNCLLSYADDTGYESYTGSTAPAGTARKSLVGINNVWSDSGSVTVTYWTH